MVSLVENDQNVTGNFLQERRKFVMAEGRAGRIIGVSDINDAGLRRNGGSDRIEIEGVIAKRRLDEISAAGPNSDRKQRERALAGNPVETGTKQHAGGEVDDLTGAQAHKHLLGAHIVAQGQHFTKTLAATIGIPVRFSQRPPRGFHSFGRRPERILVRSQLDRMDLQILFHFFDGLSRNIGREALNVIGDEFFEGVRHENSLCLR